MRIQCWMVVMALFGGLIDPTPASAEPPPSWGAVSLKKAQDTLPLHGQSSRGIEWKRPLAYGEGVALFQRGQEKNDNQFAAIRRELAAKQAANPVEALREGDLRGLRGLLGLFGLAGLVGCFYGNNRLKKVQSKEPEKHKENDGNGQRFEQLASNVGKVDDRVTLVEDRLTKRLNQHSDRLEVLEARPGLDPSLLESVRRHAEDASMEANRAKTEADRAEQAAIRAAALEAAIGRKAEEMIERFGQSAEALESCNSRLNRFTEIAERNEERLSAIEEDLVHVTRTAETFTEKLKELMEK